MNEPKRSFRRPFWQTTVFLLTLPLMFCWGTATVITEDLATDADKGRALRTRETLASQQVVDVTRHGRHIHSGNQGNCSEQT